jgi:hypothetical protein
MIGTERNALMDAPLTPGTPMWRRHVDGQSREELVDNLQRAERPSSRRRGD